jgi:hypothetical protein
MAVLFRSLPIVLLAALPASVQQRGVGTGISLKPSSVAAGALVAATATGTNPYGAVFIDWGDGTAITYPITGVPATQSHVYTSGGRFIVVSKGMGNCDGEMKTTIDISPPAVGPEAVITSVEMTPSPAFVRRPVDIAVKGRGRAASLLISATRTHLRRRGRCR